MVEDRCGNVFEFGVTVTPELEARKVPIELAIGDLSLHDAYALHGSEANTSPRRRAGFTMRYANARTVSIDTAKHWVPVYVVSGTAPVEAGYVDLRR
jgi:ectoine hydroxylase-related dioxygenase (phytanoyl-CoA dioxygenase family)